MRFKNLLKERVVERPAFIAHNLLRMYNYTLIARVLPELYIYGNLTASRSAFISAAFITDPVAPLRSGEFAPYLK